MSEDVLTTTLGERAIDLGNRMLSERRSAAVVLTDGKVSGLVSKESFIASVKYLKSKPLESFMVADLVDHCLETSTPEEDIDSVVDRMMTSYKRIDRMPVVKDGKLVGMISAGSVVSFFAANMKGRLKVRDVMEYKPVLVFDYTPIPDVIKEMDLSREKRVIVVEGQKVVGTITVLDLATALFNRMKNSDPKSILSTMKAADVMTPKPITIRPKEDAAKAAEIMTEKSIGGLPVVDKQIEGLITRTNILKAYMIAKTK